MMYPLQEDFSESNCLSSQTNNSAEHEMARWLIYEDHVGNLLTHARKISRMFLLSSDTSSETLPSVRQIGRSSPDG